MWIAVVLCTCHLLPAGRRKTDPYNKRQMQLHRTLLTCYSTGILHHSRKLLSELWFRLYIGVVAIWGSQFHLRTWEFAAELFRHSIVKIACEGVLDPQLLWQCAQRWRRWVLRISSDRGDEMVTNIKTRPKIPRALN